MNARSFVSPFKPAACLLLVWAVAVCLGLTATAAPAEDRLEWNMAADHVNARVEGWRLNKVLENIAQATGWQIFLEPGTDRTISARFEKLQTGDALRRLLGDLNFALLPQEDQPSKLFIFRTTRQAATQLVVARGKGKRIPDELVLALKPGTDAEALARRLGARIVGRVDGLNLIRLKFDDEASANAARDLAGGMSEVSDADFNYVVERPTSIASLGASAPLPTSLNPTLGGDGSKIIVGLIDTAAEATRAQFQGFFLDTINLAGDAALQGNYLTHGTSMAETLLRGLSMATQDGAAASSVRILPVDVYGNNANASTFDVARGVYAAVNAGATIINLSLGSEAYSTYLHTVIQSSQRQGVLFVGAAGNQPTISPTYPAALPEVLAVTAGDRQGNIAAYANRGSFVDVVAPGTSMVYYNGQAYMVSGTSSATALVSGMAAGIAAQTGKSLAEVEAQLRATLGVKTAP